MCPKPLQAESLRVAAHEDRGYGHPITTEEASMIILSSLSEYLMLLGSMLLMIGLARLAYGGRTI